jgi:hypothetical protein
MKLNFYFIILFPIFIVAQNNLFFERVLNFSLSSSTEVVVPDNRAWNVKTTSKGTVSFKSTNPEYGSPVLNDQSLGSQDTWLGEGDILIAPSTTYYSILEYRVVPISTNTGTSESTGFSSSGLEFNQVINISGTANSNYSGITTTDAVGIIDTFTVPDGKVWKVESAYGVNRDGPNDSFILVQSTGNIHTVGSLFKVNNTSTSGDAQFQEDVDKQITLWVSGNINGGEETGQNTPIWLSSGTYKYQVHYSSSSSRRINAHLSAVEFNIIQ